MSSKRCPLCETSSEYDRGEGGRTGWFSCPRCGEFETDFVLTVGVDSDSCHLLSGLTRERTDRKRTPLLINVDNMDDLIGLAPKRVSDKANRLLSALVRRTKYFGESIRLDFSTDHAIAFAQNNDELRSFAKLLHNQYLIEMGAGSRQGVDVTVTARGFELLEIGGTAGAASDSAFVAMWFDSSVNDAYQSGIKPAIEDDCGFQAVRNDNVEFNGDVIDEIFSGIRTARFIIAEFTDHRNGVYFEAGFAMGLRVPVIWVCREDEMDNAHFDTSHFNHITWRDPAILREKLARRIQATIGTGSYNPTP